jgi:FtsH-binding integral membrane protein
MSSRIAELRAPVSRADTGTLVGQTMALVALTAGAFALGAYLGRNVSYGWGWVLFAASLVCLIAINVAVRSSESLAIALLFGFGVLVGLAVAPTLSYYAGTNPQALWEAGGASALFVGGFGVVGYSTRRDLAPLARGLFWALLGLIAFGIAVIFVQIPHGSLIYSIAGLVVFAGLTLFDFQRLRQSTDVETAPLLAASIFLDLLNVFLLLLSLFSGERD